VEADPGFGPEPWQGALEALKREAAAWRQKRLRVSVVLSNHFVRYVIVPRADAATEEEELALARFQFAKIHGERAKGWEVRLSSAGRGDRLACAVDRGLVEALKACFPATGKPRLVSVQPYLMAAFNGWRAHIPRAGAWLLLAEPERVCLALLVPTGWRSLHNVRGSAERPDECMALIARERYRASGERLPEVVLARPVSRSDLIALQEAPETMSLAAS
jgi:hypothetical protein